MPYITTRDGAKLHYLSIGRGAPVVLLHGFAMQGAMWLPFIAPLAMRYRFILPDLRGFGGSHRVALSQPCLLTQHADDLEDLMEALNLRDVRLGGLSMGACTALQYHRLYGFDRVHSYLHMDQAPCVRNSKDWRHGLLGVQQQSRLGAWKSLMQDLEPYRGEAFKKIPKALRARLWSVLSEFFGFAFHKAGWKVFSQLAKHEFIIRNIAPTSNWPIYMDTLRSYTEDDYDWRPSLSKLAVPMTVLVGMRSTMYPAQGQLQIGKLVPNARVVKFEDCGHALPFEAPLRFTSELRQFLAAA
ncbi:MAG: alpha/beta hydrolase [Pseudomonadota bacterium]